MQSVLRASGGSCRRGVLNGFQLQTAEQHRSDEICDRVRPRKPVVGFLHDLGNNAPNTSDDPNWGGPMPRHNGGTAIIFHDGHLVSLKPVAWYWSLTPWLKPDIGGS